MKTERFLSALPVAPAGRRRMSRLLRSPLAVGGLAFATLLVAFARGTISAPVAGVGIYIALLLILRGALRGRRREWDSLCRPFPRPRSRPGRRSGRLRLAAAIAFLAMTAGSAARAQQTIFNVPSADVLDKGKFYLESDVLWRPQEPNFALFTERGVYGFGANIEAGVNFGGFLTPGRSVPYATPNIKWQPWHNETLAFTTGAFGLFYLRGSKDGNPAVLWYGEASYKLPTNTRVTAGGYWASSGYAASDPQAGALVGFEQKINDHLNIIADWISGDNGIGYFTPGVSVPLGPWTIYLGYSLKNGDSKGNAILFELGFTF